MGKGEPCSSKHQIGRSWLSEQCEFNTTSEITLIDYSEPLDVLTYLGLQLSNWRFPKGPAELICRPNDRTPSRIAPPRSCVVEH